MQIYRRMYKCCVTYCFVEIALKGTFSLFLSLFTENGGIQYVPNMHARLSHARHVFVTLLLALHGSGGEALAAGQVRYTPLNLRIITTMSHVQQFAGGPTHESLHSTEVPTHESLLVTDVGNCFTITRYRLLTCTYDPRLCPMIRTSDGSCWCKNKCSISSISISISSSSSSSSSSINCGSGR